MRKVVSREAVESAIAQLQREGKNPSIGNIRRLTGGSNHLIMQFKADILNHGSDDTISVDQSIVGNSSTVSDIDSLAAEVEAKVIAQLESRLVRLEGLCQIAPETVADDDDTIIKKQSQEIETLKAEIIKLKDEKLELYQDVTLRMGRMDKQLLSAKRVIADRNTEIEHLQVQLSEARRILATYDAERSLKAQLATARQELETLDSQCLKVSAELEDVKSHNRRLQVQLEEQVATINQLKTQLDSK